MMSHLNQFFVICLNSNLNPAKWKTLDTIDFKIFQSCFNIFVLFLDFFLAFFRFKITLQNSLQQMVTSVYNFFVLFASLDVKFFSSNFPQIKDEKIKILNLSYYNEIKIYYHKRVQNFFIDILNSDYYYHIKCLLYCLLFNYVQIFIEKL